MRVAVPRLCRRPLSSEQWVVSFEFNLNLCSFVKNTHNSLLIAHCSKAQRRLEDAKPVRANSRGFLNPWNNWQDKEIASGRRGTATVFNVERWTNVVWKIHVAVPRLCRRPLLCVLKKPRAWKPPAIHVHVFQTSYVHNSSLKASEKRPDARM